MFVHAEVGKEAIFRGIQGTHSVAAGTPAEVDC